MENFFFRNFHFKGQISQTLDTSHFVSVITKSNFESNFNFGFIKYYRAFGLNVRK